MSSSGAPPPACPDEHGLYSVTVSGKNGCGTLDDSEDVCITQGVMCGIALTSKLPAVGAVEGETSIKDTGDFIDATILVGGVMRSGCSGTWNASSSQLTIDCGGMVAASDAGPSQICVFTLTRISMSCT